MALTVAPIAIPWVAAALLALLDGRRAWVGWAGVAALAASAAAALGLTVTTIADGPRAVVAGDWPAGVGIVLRADALGAVFALLSLAVLLAALAHQVVAGVERRALPSFVLFMGAGLSGLFLTGDIFNFYVFFELAMIAGYVLSTYGGKARHVGSAFVFAVVNLLGSFLFLIAVAAIYQLAGTLTMTDVAERLSDVEPGTAMPIAVAIFVAFGVKIGLFPFHFWLPPLYIGAQPAIAAILSGALANIGSYGLLRFGVELFPAQLDAGAGALLAIGLASVLYGSAQALSRRDPGEVLAYSAVGQAGYVLVAIAIGGPVGYAAAVVYAVVNAIAKALLFLTAPLRGRISTAVFAIGAFSVVGLPPTAGFLGKLELFRAGLDGGAAVVALLLVGSALSFVYMLQLYQHAFWAEERPGPPSPLPLRSIAAVLCALVLALGLWPQPLSLAGSEAAAALEAGR